MALSGDTTLEHHLASAHEEKAVMLVEEVRARLQEEYQRPLAQVFDAAVQKQVSAIQREVFSQRQHTPTTAEEWFSRLTFSPTTGIPILLLVMFLVYEFVGVVGAGILVDFLESTVFDGYVVPWCRAAAARPGMIQNSRVVIHTKNTSRTGFAPPLLI